MCLQHGVCVLARQLGRLRALREQRRSYLFNIFRAQCIFFFLLISLQDERSISAITDGGYVDHHNLMNLIPLSILDFQLNCINTLLLA